MSKPCRFGLVALFALLQLPVGTPLFAEVSVQNPTGAASLIHIFGKQDDPDPWPHFGTVLPTPLPQVLNPMGDVNGDRYADIIYRYGRPPAVVWSAWDGADFEIAYSEWSGTAWSAAVLLTSNSVNDTFPRIALDGVGQPMIVWQRSGAPDGVFSIRRGVTGAWEAEARVSEAGQVALSPALAIPANGTPRCSYEVAMSPKRIVVSRLTGGGSPTWIPEIVALTPFTGDTAPRVDTRGGRTWVSWVHSDTHIGWSELVGGVWTSPQWEPYAGPSDVEAARFRIRNRLGP